MKTSRVSPLIWSIGILVVYVVMRLVIYEVSSAKYGEAYSWWERDIAMTIPRFLAGAAALVVGCLMFGRRGLGLHFGKYKLGLLLSAVSVLIGGLDVIFVHGLSHEASMRWWITIGITTVFVAIFEEVLFRGTLLQSLLRVTSPRVSALISSLLFMGFHYGAQHVAIFPELFLFGMACAFARLVGVGLGWLIFEHWAFDTLMLAGFGFDAGLTGISALQIIMLAGLAYYFWRRYHRPGLSV